jgi:hypothetical protein
MARIVAGSVLPPNDNPAAGSEAGGAKHGSDPPSGGVGSDHAFGPLFDLLDRVDRDAAVAASQGRSGPADPTELPSRDDCRRSLTAIAAAGFTDVHLQPVPYFNQGARQWAGHPYPRQPPVPGESRTIEDAGCAPTALAMIDCALRDAHTRPEVTADFAVKHRLSGAPGGFGSDTAGLAREWAARHGLAMTPATSRDQSRNVDVLKAGLDANGIALVSVGVDRAIGRGHFTSAGHVLVINGCARRGGEEWFAIANPGRANQASAHGHPGLLTTDADVTQIGGAKNGIGQVWISRTQLEAEMKRCFVFHSGTRS